MQLISKQLPYYDQYLNNMQRFQTGGTVNFHVIANTARASEDADTTTSKSSSKQQSLISDSLMKSLYTEGIPVDVDWLSGKIANLEHRAAIGLGVSSSEVWAINAQINRVVQNAKYLEAAEKQAIKNDALADIAVDDKGYMYVMTEKGLGKKRITEFNAEKEQALTVSDLINYRKNVPSLAFDNDYIQTISTSIGTTKIQEYITGILSTIGDSVSATDAYTNLATVLGKDIKKLTEQEYKALSSMAQIAQQVGLDAVFKESIKSKDSNMQAALGYLQRVLPRNMQYQLRAQYVAAGGNAKDDNIVELLTYAGATYNKSSREYSVDYEKAVNEEAGTSKTANQRNLKAIEVLTQGTLNKTNYHLTSSKNPSLQMTLHGNVSGVLTNYDNNIIPKAPISTAIESSIGPLIDKNHVTMGDQKINESMFDTILYDGNDVINIWAPTDANGDIDLQGLQQFNDILDYFNQDKALSMDDKNKILQEYGINGTIDENNNFHGSGNMAQFFVFTGITSDEVLSKDNVFADVLNKEQKNYEFDQIERIYGQLNSKIKNKDGHLKFNKGWFNWSTDILKAPVFMKMRPTAQQEVGALSNYGPRVDQQTYANAAVQDQMRYNRQNGQQVYKPSTSLIYE